MSLDLETYTALHGFRLNKPGGELWPVKMKWYKCPECGGGPVTDHGGSVYICSDCRWQL